MERFFELFVKIIHSISGFFVHPEKGGCCGFDKSDKSDKNS